MISTLERLRSSRAALEHRLAPPAPPPRPPRWPPRASAPDAKATADKRSTLTTKYRDRLFMSYLLSPNPARSADPCRRFRPPSCDPPRRAPPLSVLQIFRSVVDDPVARSAAAPAPSID